MDVVSSLSVSVNRHHSHTCFVYTCRGDPYSFIISYYLQQQQQSYCKCQRVIPAPSYYIIFSSYSCYYYIIITTSTCFFLLNVLTIFVTCHHFVFVFFFSLSLFLFLLLLLLLLSQCMSYRAKEKKIRKKYTAAHNIDI